MGSAKMNKREQVLTAVRSAQSQNQALNASLHLTMRDAPGSAVAAFQKVLNLLTEADMAFDDLADSLDASS
jgi:phage gp37-like protein